MCEQHRCALAAGTIASCGELLKRLAQDLGLAAVLRDKQAVAGQQGGARAEAAIRETLQLLG